MFEKKVIVILIILFFSIVFFIFLFNTRSKMAKNDAMKENNLRNEVRDEDSINNLSQSPINIDEKNMNVIPNPDEIIYYLDDEKIIVDKNSEKYLTIIEMNKARAEVNFGLLQLNLPSVSKMEAEREKFLEYKYNEVSIYFTLYTSNDEYTHQYVIIRRDNPYFESGVYGLSYLPCDELVKFLKE